MIETVKDGIQQIATTGKEQVAARLSNPVLGPFLLSWLFCNYRIFFVLFSNDPLSERFAEVDFLTTPLKDYLLGRGLLVPLAITLGYIFLVPVVAEGVLLWNLAMKRRQKAAEQRSEGLELLTKNQSVQLRAGRIEKERQLADLMGQLFSLKAKLAGWRVMSKGHSPNHSRNYDSAIETFLLSQEFDVFYADRDSSALATLSFNEANSAFCSEFFADYARHVDRWSVTQGSLTLVDANGVVTGRFSFLPDRGVFLGSIKNDSVELRGKVFVLD